jgi:uncharacterized glyoxalase superfamily protein PhnB
MLKAVHFTDRASAIEVYVEDVDRHYDRAKAEGATQHVESPGEAVLQR